MFTVIKNLQLTCSRASVLASLLCMASLMPCWAGNIPQRITLSSNRRYLVDEAGKPFFYLADTAWELFHKLNREEAELYLKDRAEKGFTALWLPWIPQVPI